ncbi:hypothetical protein B4U80_13308 [Leptotrombidium deliense]|uniref:Uncharacterized protein n=1 Tax=Leptotrombidium deliense TaxID=299467 RepID=A0A443S8J5_9ACAR|nr:hypothetical protein B4U80_13308 [Leptotrombidium deliense]
MTAIGIDFGYSAIRAAVLLYNRNNEDKSVNSYVYKIPVVTMNLKKLLFGSEDIETQNVITFEAIILGLKRMIGKYNNIMRSELKLPFESIDYFIEDKNAKINISNEKQKHSPEYLLALLLDKIVRELKKSLGDFNDVKVTHAVISVPAYFTHPQREALINAGIIADIKVQLLNDTTAIAVNEEFNSKEVDDVHKLLVINFGASSFEVSMMEIEGNVIRVVANTGTTSLGGIDFDTKLANYYLRDSDYYKEYGLEPYTVTQQKMYKLLKKCEKAKIDIQSGESSSEIVIHKKRGYRSICMSTHYFEKICSDLFEKARYLINKVLVDSECTEKEYFTVILAGGSSNLRKIKSGVKKLFSPSRIRYLTSMDEIVKGCAIMAATSDAETCFVLRKLSIKEISPFNIVVKHEQSEYGFNIIGSRFSVLPQTRKVLMSIEKPKNEQTLDARIDVFIGEKSSFFKNKKLMTISLGIFSKLVTTFKLQLHIDRNGVYTFTAEHVPNDQLCHVKVVCNNDSDKIEAIENFDQIKNEVHKQANCVTNESVCESNSNNIVAKLSSMLKKSDCETDSGKIVSTNTTKVSKSDSNNLKQYFVKNFDNMLPDDSKRLNKKIGIACYYWDKNEGVDVLRYPGDYAIETITKEIDQCEQKKAEIHEKIKTLIEEIEMKKSEIEKDITFSNSMDKAIASQKDFIGIEKEKNVSEYNQRLSEIEKLKTVIDETQIKGSRIIVKTIMKPFSALKERRRTKEQILKNVRLMKEKSPLFAYKNDKMFSVYESDIQEKLLSFELFLKQEASGKCETEDKYKILNDTIETHIKSLKNERQKLKAMTGIQNSVKHLSTLLNEYKRFNLSENETLLIDELSGDVKQWVSTLSEQRNTTDSGE